MNELRVKHLLKLLQDLDPETPVIIPTTDVHYASLAMGWVENVVRRKDGTYLAISELEAEDGPVGVVYDALVLDVNIPKELEPFVTELTGGVS